MSDDEGVRLGDVASVVRSKNAGPFATTLDIFFEDDDAYQRFKDAEVINPELLSRLYNIEPRHILGIFHLDTARGIKASFVKPSLAAGDVGSSDMYSCQQNAPLLDLKVPAAVHVN